MNMLGVPDRMLCAKPSFCSIDRRWRDAVDAGLEGFYYSVDMIRCEDFQCQNCVHSLNMAGQIPGLCPRCQTRIKPSDYQRDIMPYVCGCGAWLRICDDAIVTGIAVIHGALVEQEDTI